MKSKAALRFNLLHPNSHADFQNLLQSAKKRKESCDEEITENIDQEVANMMKNKVLTRWTEEDKIYCDTEKKNKKLLNKKITWSENLIEVEIVLDCNNFSDRDCDDFQTM